MSATTKRTAHMRPACDVFAQVSISSLAIIDVRRRGGIERLLRTHIHRIGTVVVWHVCEEPDDQDDPHAGERPVARRWVYPCDVLAEHPPLTLPGIHA